MHLPARIAATAAVLALSIAPAALAASGPPANAGNGHAPTASTALASSDSTGAKSYGTYCKAARKKHVAGQNGTPFSQCVSAAAKLLKDKQDDASETSTDDGAGS